MTLHRGTKNIGAWHLSRHLERPLEEVPFSELGAAFLAAAQRCIPQTSAQVRAPTEDGLTEFTVAYTDGYARPIKPAEVRVVGLKEIPARAGVDNAFPYWEATLESEREIPGDWRRFVWMYGDPEPEIIAQLGIRVVA